MNEMTPLVDLLGMRWELGSPVVKVVWDRSGSVAGFALGDGTIAMASTRCGQAPLVVDRPGGGVELHPVQDVPPISRQGVHVGAILDMAPDFGGGFLTGGVDGQLMRTSVDGATELVANFDDGVVDKVAVGTTELRACCVGPRVYVFGGKISQISLTSVPTALAFDSTSRRLAVAHAQEVTLWEVDTDTIDVLKCSGHPETLCWSHDRTSLACGLHENHLYIWRNGDSLSIKMTGSAGHLRSLSFSNDVEFLAVGGDAQITCWHLDVAGQAAYPSKCGVPGSNVLVAVVACNPVRPVIAAGYENGAVILCQPASTEVLFVRGAGGGAVTTMSWSPDGAMLAFGNGEGEAAIAIFPERIFRGDDGRKSAVSKMEASEKMEVR